MENDIDRIGLEVEYEYIEIELTDIDCAKIEYFQDGKKDILNLIGRGKILVQRRKWL
jgi:hypothetical protein